jgi:hypothetical protein
MLFHSLVFNLVCFVELVAVNFGMVASAWLLANDTAYAKEKKRMRSEREELYTSGGSSRPPASALEERDEESAVSPQAVRIRPPAGSAAPAGSAEKDTKPAVEEDRNAVTTVRKESLATRIKVAIDVDGDGHISIREALCQSSVPPSPSPSPNPNPNPNPSPDPNPNPNPNPNPTLTLTLP